MREFVTDELLAALVFGGAHDAGRFAWPLVASPGFCFEMEETGEVLLAQATPVATSRPTLGTPAMLDACADTIVAVLRLTGTLI